MDDVYAGLDDWSQGDLVLEPMELPYVTREGDELEIEFIKAPFGIAVLTQTCEIIKRPRDGERWGVNVAALVLVDDEEKERIERGDKPNHALVAGAAELNLAIDFDAVATVDKGVLVRWPRTPGCITDADKRDLGRQLARHRQRYAFPDSFNDNVLRTMRRWVESKRRKQSAHGEFIRAVAEFRVWCDCWDSPTETAMLAIMKREPKEGELAQWLSAFDDMVQKGFDGEKPTPTLRIEPLDDISAAEYLASDRLDWDALSDV